MQLKLKGGIIIDINSLNINTNNNSNNNPSQSVNTGVIAASNNQTTITTTSQNVNTGLNRFSYADYVLLSSTISYAIAEEVNVEDLEILVTFLGMISSDLALLLIKKGREARSQQAAQEADIESESDEVSDEDIGSTLPKNIKTRKVKKVRKRKKKRVILK